MAKLASASYEFETIDQVGRGDHRENRNRFHRNHLQVSPTPNGIASYSRYSSVSGTIDHLNSLNSHNPIHRAYDNPLLSHGVPELALYSSNTNYGSRRQSISPTQQKLPPPYSFSPPYHIYPNHQASSTGMSTLSPIRYRGILPLRVHETSGLGNQLFFRSSTGFGNTSIAGEAETNKNKTNDEYTKTELQKPLTYYVGSTTLSHAKPIQVPPRLCHAHGKLSGALVGENRDQLLLGTYSNQSRDICGTCEIERQQLPRERLQDAWEQQHQRTLEYQLRRAEIEADIALQERNRIQKLRNDVIIEESRREATEVKRLLEQKNQLVDLQQVSNSNEEKDKAKQLLENNSYSFKNDELNQIAPSHSSIGQIGSLNKIGKADVAAATIQKIDAGVNTSERNPFNSSPELNFQKETQKKGGHFPIMGAINALHFGHKLKESAHQTHLMDERERQIEEVRQYYMENFGDDYEHRNIVNASNDSSLGNSATEEERIRSRQMKLEVESMNKRLQAQLQQGTTDVNDIQTFIRSSANSPSASSKENNQRYQYKQQMKHRIVKKNAHKSNLSKHLMKCKQINQPM